MKHVKNSALGKGLNIHYFYLPLLLQWFDSTIYRYTNIHDTFTVCIALFWARKCKKGEVNRQLTRGGENVEQPEFSDTPSGNIN